jgi:hypothetical protein
VSCQAIVSREGKEMIVCGATSVCTTFLSMPNKVPFEMEVELCAEHTDWVMHFNPDAHEIP